MVISAYVIRLVSLVLVLLFFGQTPHVFSAFLEEKGELQLEVARGRQLTVPLRLSYNRHRSRSLI